MSKKKFDKSVVTSVRADGNLVDIAHDLGISLSSAFSVGLNAMIDMKLRDFPSDIDDTVFAKWVECRRKQCGAIQEIVKTDVIVNELLEIREAEKIKRAAKEKAQYKMRLWDETTNSYQIFLVNGDE